jgi:hypothetical protein
MPISKDEFESGKVLSELEKAIVTFLQRNRDKAFTSNEIMDGINIQADFSDWLKAIASGIVVLTFPSILNNLVISGKIKMNMIQGSYYYMAK